jgi:hypothetical protein
MRGWWNEPQRHSLAARGLKTNAMDTGPGTTERLLDRYLTPELDAILSSARTPRDLNELITANENLLVSNRNARLGKWWGDYLVCDEVVEIMVEYLRRMGRDYEIVMGFNDHGDTHVWVRVDGINYDPTDQGMHEGQVIERWTASDGRTEEFKYVEPDVEDFEAYKRSVVVIDGLEDNERLMSSGRRPRPIVVVDLDGTVYDVSTRLESAKKTAKYGTVKFWDTFMDAGKVETDRPIPGVKNVLRSLEKDASIIYLSGRRESLLGATQSILRRDGMPRGEALILKPKGLNTERWKASVLLRLTKDFDNIVAGVGDRESDMKAYRRAGIPAVKVVSDARWNKRSVDRLRRLVK